MLNKSRNFLRRLVQDQRGLTAVEYAVLGAVIVAGITALGTTFEDGLKGAFTALFNQVN